MTYVLKTGKHISNIYSRQKDVGNSSHIPQLSLSYLKNVHQVIGGIFIGLLFNKYKIHNIGIQLRKELQQDIISR